MRGRTVTIADWETFRGSESFDGPSEGIQRLDISIVSEGCSVFVETKDGPTLVAFGSGRFDVQCGIVGDFAVNIVGRSPDHYTSVLLPWRRVTQVGWVMDEAPFTQLETKAPDEVSPQIREMVENMQRNAARREALLLAELKRLRG